MKRTRAHVDIDGEVMRNYYNATRHYFSQDFAKHKVKFYETLNEITISYLLKHPEEISNISSQQITFF